ncbi:SbcC-like subunit of palindrome specific endonuclease [Synechococcus phage S-T4]|jgi:DNA repair exonuclease SbcCD ATPase subunit|uniref:Recombination-related endonuclease n=1 Tax=Synechococcus phage S-T4 TaxID=2268578 RepID=A0A385EH11_9CAUD|nr:SbcC-like subunit of palindrome specific endonuclease [Synechococcus phage S-T4]AXQ70565.1 recombination-related endonuclease [Synechococcus phage S-T4]
MITFKKIRWRNFLSTGNQWTEINFTENSNTIIIGTNGSGKSTLLDALTFVLFNKPFRKINKPQLINTTNEKDCLVEIEFSVGKKEYFVRRGMKPNVFDIEVNGNPLHKEADDRSNQRILEDNILKLNHKSFTQVVILGSSTFVPFMQLSGGHRREVIEDILDIKIFSAMNSIIKEKIKIFRDKSKVLEIKKDAVIDKIKMQEEFINELENRGNANINSKKESIAKIMDEVGQYTEKNLDLLDETSHLQTVISGFEGASDKLRKLGNLKGKISQKVSTITKEHKFFNEHTVCPTCDQDIEEEFRLNRIEAAQSKAKELQSGYKELEQAIKEEEQREQQFKTISKEIVNLNHEISKNNSTISGFQRQVQQLESEIQTIANQLENRNTEHDKLVSFQNELEKIYTDLSDQKESLSYHDFAFSLLKDGGVKRQIIKKYLPLINQQVNRYLRMMDFYINFKLDEEFNESIQSPIHEKFSYASFSEGEKMRIDLALLFTWREIARTKNSVNTNLLIMDEVFDSSLDGFGTEEFLKIIKYVIKDANIFVISHKDGLYDKFESVIKFDKVKGFSRIV